MPKYTKEERAEAIETLRGLLKPGDTVYCILRHVSKSGMRRHISLITFKNDKEGKPQPCYISYNAACVLGWPMTKKGESALIVDGAGMDMGFHTVYTLSRALFADMKKAPEHGKDAGYSLQHRWL